MSTKKPAVVAFEDGFVLRGTSFGAEGEAFGEVVFNTSMTGYQEILTDPSHKGQIVTMTYPLIGNYGVNEEDMESSRPWAEGFIVRENSRIKSNWRSTATLDEYMKKHNIVGIEGIDTRAITRHTRLQGALKGVISTADLDEKSLIEKAKSSPGLIGRDLVKDVACNEAWDWDGKSKIPLDSARGRQNPKFKVVAVDCGIKYNILRLLTKAGCGVKVVPAAASADEILSHKPDGLFLSNGPGDPEAVSYLIDTVRSLLGKLPIFGICLGHQILGLALGGKTYKLKFGHHGGNQPVMDLNTRKVEITAQNHGFCVDVESIPDKGVALTHINLNDKTAEGMEHKKLKAFSVQYHPEASPGPHDAGYLFKRFTDMMR